MKNLLILLNFLSIFWLTLLSQTTIGSALEMPENLKKQARKLHERCQKQTGVAEDLIRQSHDGNIPDDSVLKCYIHCLFDMIGLIDTNEIVHLEYLLEVTPAEAHDIIKNLIGKCGTKKGADACDTAYRTVKCYYEVDKPSLMAAFGFIFE